jgi:hypothetical protein
MSRNEGLNCREDVRDYGIMFEAIAEHFIPGDVDCLATPEAEKDAKNARRLLLNRGLAPTEIKKLVHDATYEAKHLQAWLSVIKPEDFYEKTIW